MASGGELQPRMQQKCGKFSQSSLTAPDGMGMLNAEDFLIVLFQIYPIFLLCTRHLIIGPAP